MPLLVGNVYDEQVVVSYGEYNGTIAWCCSGDSVTFKCDRPHVYPHAAELSREVQIAYVEFIARRHLLLHVSTPFN